MKALVIGATGATGRDITKLLLADSRFEEVHIFVRKAMVSYNAKLKVHIVNFDDIDSWGDKIVGDVLFSAMGTTLSDAGNKDAQWKVDYAYQYEVAKHARANGVQTYALVSAMGATAKSRLFYPMMKGKLEEAVKDLKFKRTIIARPPSLIRENTTRMSEKLSLPILRFFNAIGLLKNMAPMTTEVVAKAMIEAVEGNQDKVVVLEPSDMRRGSRA
ncbi:MAG: NAD(P)H-binding protein [Bacteroidales bacterium]|nr:NAD(P)H-binding protein [Bacteroidales bacterium]